MFLLKLIRFIFVAMNFARANSVYVKNNAYHNIVIAINPDVTESTALIENIKVSASK